MKKLCMFFWAFALLVAGGAAQTLSGAENLITSVSVSGLRRTKPHIIERPLQKYIGMEAESIDINEVFALVKSAGILEPLSVELLDSQDGTGKILAVTVRDKWSIFPIPIVGIHSGGWSAGGVLVDANAFGINDTIMAMGLFGGGDIATSVMYINSPDDIGKFGWNVMGFFSLQENENTDQTGKQVLRRYNSMSIHPLFGLSYLLSEHIIPSLSFSCQYVALRDADKPINEPESGVQGITLSPSVIFRNTSTWDGYFLNEKQMTLKYDFSFIINGGNAHSATMDVAFNHSIIPGFRLAAKGSAFFATPSASPFFELSPSTAVNILPTSYSARNFAGLSIGLEKYLFKFSQGTVSLTAAYQGIYTHGDLLAHQFDHGPVAMLLMYFSKLALPAVGLGGAYNVSKNAWQYAFNVGMTF
jgi:hypothetical protein